MSIIRQIILEEILAGALANIAVNGETQIKVTPFAEGGAAFTVDAFTGDLVIIDHAHHKTHLGKSFRVGSVANLANNATIDIVLATGDTTTHLEYYANVGGNSTIDFYEAPTVTGGTGTAMTIFNKRRDSATASVNAARLNQTVTGTGTALQSLFVPGGTGGIANGGSGSERKEWVLTANTTYLLRLTNIAGTTQYNNLALEWYEV